MLLSSVINHAFSTPLGSKKTHCTAFLQRRNGMDFASCLVLWKFFSKACSRRRSEERTFASDPRVMAKRRFFFVLSFGARPKKRTSYAKIRYPIMKKIKKLHKLKPLKIKDYLLILTLITLLALSLLSTLQLIRSRTCKMIFFYEFVFFLGVCNFILICVTYSLLQREDLLEELLAKVFTTLVMVYAAECMKIRTEPTKEFECRVCFNVTEHHDCMILPCSHIFHEGCLWDWIYYKKCCPTCCKPYQP